MKLIFKIFLMLKKQNVNFYINVYYKMVAKNVLFIVKMINK